MTDQPSKVVPVSLLERCANVLEDPSSEHSHDTSYLIEELRLIAAATHEEAQTAAPQGGGEALRIVASHLPTPDCPDSVCIPVTLTAGDLRTILAALKPQTPDVLGEAREAFYDLIADARRWEEIGDEDGFSYELHFGQHSLLPLMSAFGIECLSFPIEQDGEIFGGMETPADAIYRASNAPNIPTPPGDVLDGVGEGR